MVAAYVTWDLLAFSMWFSELFSPQESVIKVWLTFYHKMSVESSEAPCTKFNDIIWNTVYLKINQACLS